jgi:hypothetical protein
MNDNRYQFDEEKIDLGLDTKKTIFRDIGGSAILGTELVSTNRFSMKGSIAEIAGFKQSVDYKRMREKNVKVVFRITTTSSSLNNNVDDVESNGTTSMTLLNSKINRSVGIAKNRGLFVNIISELVSREKDSELEKDFKDIFKI